MTVLFLMIGYPDVSQNTSMYTDLAREFALNGHEVYVAVANGPSTAGVKNEGGISVLRVKTMELFNTSFIRKGLANLFLPFQVNREILKHWDSVLFDSIIVSTPPITYLNTIVKLKKKIKCKVYLILRDIFPQNAIDLEIIKNPILINMFRRHEKRLYNISDSIGCMSTGNVKYISKLNQGITEKLHLLPNWKQVFDYSPPDLSLKKQMGLENKFIALYGGNFGKPQKAEFILELAGKMSVHEDVIFLFIGGGTEKQKIIELAARFELKNVLFKDSLPRHQYNEVVKFCDIGLVNLSDKFTIPNIPSRALSYWEAKIPVLASIDAATDFGEILAASGSGLSSITGDLDSYINNFERLYSDKELRKRMGESGFNYLRKNCTVEKAYSTINGKLLS